MILIEPIEDLPSVSSLVGVSTPVAWWENQPNCLPSGNNTYLLLTVTDKFYFFKDLFIVYV